MSCQTSASRPNSTRRNARIQRHGRDLLAMFVTPRDSMEPVVHTSILAPGCDTYAGIPAPNRRQLRGLYAVC